MLLRCDYDYAVTRSICLRRVRPSPGSSCLRGGSGGLRIRAEGQASIMRGTCGTGRMKETASASLCVAKPTVGNPHGSRLQP
jgi:hypothetical protein